MRPLSNRSAWATYDRFLADGRIGWADEPRGLERRWRGLTSGTQRSPKLWMDGYLAAFAIAGGHQLVTADKAFRQFKGLDLVVLERG
jgi:predicted nucleic acid-binding protein